MYKIYLKQAWALIRQERLFSLIYVVGTGLAISMVMAIAVAYHIRTANIAPEVHRDRMCYLQNVKYEWKDTEGNYKAACGPRFVKEVIGNLSVPADVAVTTSSFMLPFVYGDVFMRVPGGDESPKVRLKGCDDGFWRVYRFSFVEGRPFTKEEFLSGVPRVVLCRSLAGRLFGHEAAAGQTVWLNDLEYTVSGVVEDVSGVTADVYAEAWVTYSSLSVTMDQALDEREGAAGLLEANILLADASDLPALSEELRRQVRRYNSGLSEGRVVCEDPLSYADNLLAALFGPETYIVLGMALLLFLLVPALNLSGLSASRIQERVGELGIRKAFGATRATLMGQIFLENMVLMLPGGVAGLLFSYGLVFVFRDTLLVPRFNLLGASGEVFLSPGMLLNMSVFAYAFGVCVVLNLLSSMLPAWRIVRGNITEALNE
ncbi:MAG: ABC transporter permease [Parabacteroides sp.]|nr:ABC transporter permease [Parabacteroides sp.]